MKAESDQVELEMRPVGPFRSPNDEAAFFGWLDRISSVTKYEGQGDTLYISVRKSQVDEEQLTDLLALFFRYQVDMKQLVALEKPEFSTWLRDKKAYWAESVFG